jgi:hypothetical protein
VGYDFQNYEVYLFCYNVTTIIQIIILMYLYKNVILHKQIYMIQRVQSIYLLLVIFINVVYKVFIDNCLSIHFPVDLIMTNWILSIYIYMIPTVLISLISLFSYKHRNRQLILNRVNILFQLILLVSFFYKLIGFDLFYIVLLFNIVLIILANYGIIKDENLIKSLDRFR